MVVRDVAHPDQALAVPLPGDFASGAHRGRFHPEEGQLWVTGMTGWITYGPEPGCLQCMRHTGDPVMMPVSWEARDNGVLLTFPHPGAAGQTRWLAQSWNYRYGAAYGSEEFSAREPGRPGHDWLDVTGVHAIGDGRRLFVEIRQLQPAHVVHLHAPDGPSVARDFFLTVHRLGPPFTDFPGFQTVAKIPHPLPTAEIATAVRPDPVPWEQGEPGRPIFIQAAPGIQFAQREMTVAAGERLSLTFDNPDIMPHNWVLGTRGSTSRLFTLANQFITDPRAHARHYVPPAPEVIVYTRMVDPASSTTIHFTAPTEPGDFPYLCTFPGHAAIMRGILHVQ